MKKNLVYYANWNNKWIKILHYLWWKNNPSFKEKNLADKVQKHLWLIERRLLCVKWFDGNAEGSSLFPKTLKIAQCNGETSFKIAICLNKNIC